MSPGEITVVMFETARFDVESALTCKINLFLGFFPAQNERMTLFPTSGLCDVEPRLLSIKSVFTHVASIYANLLKQKKAFA